MGYTHYWTQNRSFTADEWTGLSTDIAEILKYVENDLGVPLADGGGEHATRPVFDADDIIFNGLGDDAHETFIIHRKRQKAWEGGRLGGDFCKTARKPYDVAVTACLCYLASVTETHVVNSDGRGGDFMTGLATARAAVPSKANVLDIPLDLMKEDRWTGPWISGQQGSGYEVHFCIDGYGYVERLSTHDWYRFESHEALGRFLTASKTAIFRKSGRTSFGRYEAVESDIWNASGSFDEARHKRIARAQAKALYYLFPVWSESVRPPAFVRPGDLPRPEEQGAFCYSLTELMQRCDSITA